MRTIIVNSQNRRGRRIKVNKLDIDMDLKQLNEEYYIVVMY